MPTLCTRAGQIASSLVQGSARIFLHADGLLLVHEDALFDRDWGSACGGQGLPDTESNLLVHI